MTKICCWFCCWLCCWLCCFVADIVEMRAAILASIHNPNRLPSRKGAGMLRIWHSLPALHAQSRVAGVRSVFRRGCLRWGMENIWGILGLYNTRRCELVFLCFGGCLRFLKVRACTTDLLCMMTGAKHRVRSTRGGNLSHRARATDTGVLFLRAQNMRTRSVRGGCGGINSPHEDPASAGRIYLLAHEARF